MKQIILIIQLFIVFLQTVIYIFSPYDSPSFLIINTSALTTIFSFSLSWHFRNLTALRGYGFSLIFFFFIMSWIVSFQVPMEIVYGNTQLLESNLNLVYNPFIINKLVSFLALSLNLFLIGVSLGYNNKKPVNKNSEFTSEKKLPNNIPLIFIVVLMIVFLVNMNPLYISGGHGSVSLGSISTTSAGLIIKISIIYLAIKMTNYKKNLTGLTKFITIMNPIYLAIMAVIVLLFFLANNRFYPMMIGTPILFSYFILRKKKLSLLKLTSLFLLLSIFATVLRVYGIEDLFASSLDIDDAFIITKFKFPYTAELAASFYSSTILFDLWYNSNFTIYGLGFFIGLLRTVPGLVGLLDISPITYDSGVIATIYARTEYGVGTTPFIDLLINFGFILSLTTTCLIGYFFSKSELCAYSKDAGIYSYTIYLSITILILFYPRYTLSDLIQMTLFSIIFIKIYLNLFKKTV